MSAPLVQNPAAFSNLVEIATTINSSLDPEDVLPNILAMAQRVMDATAASVALIDEATRELVYVVATGEHGQRVKENIRLKPGEGLGGWVAQTGQPVVVADVPGDPRFNLAAARRIGLIPRSMVCVPMRVRQKIIGILQAIDPVHKAAFDEKEGEFFQAFASLAATAIQNARQHKALLQQQSERQEREIARQIQQSFLPGSMPVLPGATVHGYYEPAHDLAGDFYDVVRISPTKLGLLVADVTGKGLAASLHMVRCLFGVRRLAMMDTPPARALAEINGTLAEEATARLTAAMVGGQTPAVPVFLGLIYATFDDATGELRYANAGLPDPMLCAGARSETLSAGGGPTLGMIPDATYEEASRTLGPGETLLLFTDGLSEARNLGAIEFGCARIGEALAHPHDSAAGAATLVTSAVHHFMGSAERHDDLTFVALHRQGR